MKSMIAVLYSLALYVISSNSGTTVLRLNSKNDKIVEGPPMKHIADGSEHLKIEDEIFYIVTSTVYSGNSWSKKAEDSFCSNPPIKGADKRLKSKTEKDNAWRDSTDNEYMENNKTSDILDCGRPVKSTDYDNLIGVANRNKHPNIPEPQVIDWFKIKCPECEINLNIIEKKLKNSKKERTKGPLFYTEIGNYWRIKGDIKKSIECFRYTLSVAPNNAEALLSLARVLLHLQYLDDSIYLTRRSLQSQPSSENAFQQYFTFAQIFKAYGQYKEAVLHLRHVLELKPDFEPAIIALKEMESFPGRPVHIYTLVIILLLVVCVLLVMRKITETSCEEITHQ